jgi:hypothetical protein
MTSLKDNHLGSLAFCRGSLIFVLTLERGICMMDIFFIICSVFAYVAFQSYLLFLLFTLSHAVTHLGFETSKEMRMIAPHEKYLSL